MSVTFTAYRYHPDRQWFQFVEGAPDLDTSNATARALLRALELEPLDGELVGSVPSDSLPALHQRISALKASPAAIEPFAVPGMERRSKPTLSVIDGEGRRTVRPGNCAVIDFGVPPERLAERLPRIEEIVAFCERGGFVFGWA